MYMNRIKKIVQLSKLPLYFRSLKEKGKLNTSKSSVISIKFYQSNKIRPFSHYKNISKIAKIK